MSANRLNRCFFDEFTFSWLAYTEKREYSLIWKTKIRATNQGIIKKKT